MKNKLVFLLPFLLLTGCGNKNELRCLYNSYDFDEGKMNISVTYEIDSQDYIVSSTKTEYRFYNKSEDAKAFYEKTKTLSKMINDTEVEYMEAMTYEDKVLYNQIKKAMEGQGYLCEIK